MNCQDALNLIHGYLDGELDLVRNLDIERHLQECPACARVYQNHKVVGNALRAGSFYHPAPVGLRQHIQSRLRQGRQPGLGRPSVPRRFLRVAAPLPAVAASLALVALTTAHRLGLIHC